MHPLSVSRLLLSHFRCYESLNLELVPGPVVLTGPNGAGKTNILEALSFLSPGRGLRSARLTDIDKQGTGQPWAVAAWVRDDRGEAQQIGTGRSVEQLAKRIIKINGQPLKTQAELVNAFGVVWLTPQMDSIFLEASSERRKFLDRLVFNFDPEHASRVNRYEQAMRERARLLKDARGGDQDWLSTLEAQMAEAAIAVAAARLDGVSHIQAAIYAAPTVFPKASLGIEGSVESMLQSMPALQAEAQLKEQLHAHRPLDRAAGRTHIGTHRTDLLVQHIDKNMQAHLCSTGEQKALLLSIILAEARATARWKQRIPVLLLDEVVAHLDVDRRASLFDELLDMKAQAWLTGTDKVLFEALKGRAQFLEVERAMVGSK